MAEELQGLLKRIKEEGISQVEAEKKAMMEKAENEANAILEEARKQADAMLKEAEASAQQTRERGEEALRQASRDLRISVRDALKKELEAAIKLEIKSTLNKDTMTGIIDRMISVFEQQKGEVTGIEVLLSDSDKNDLEGFFTEKFTGRLKDGVVLKPSTAIEAGIQIGTKGDNLFVDFTDDALTEMLCEYLNPRISKLVQESMER